MISIMIFIKNLLICVKVFSFKDNFRNLNFTSVEEINSITTKGLEFYKKHYENNFEENF